jgi:hypothetical protein
LGDSFITDSLPYLFPLSSILLQPFTLSLLAHPQDVVLPPRSELPSTVVRLPQSQTQRQRTWPPDLSGDSFTTRSLPYLFPFSFILLDI